MGNSFTWTRSLGLQKYLPTSTSVSRERTERRQWLRGLEVSCVQRDLIGLLTMVHRILESLRFFVRSPSKGPCRFPLGILVLKEPWRGKGVYVGVECFLHTGHHVFQVSTSIPSQETHLVNRVFSTTSPLCPVSPTLSDTGVQETSPSLIWSRVNGRNIFKRVFFLVRLGDSSTRSPYLNDRFRSPKFVTFPSYTPDRHGGSKGGSCSGGSGWVKSGRREWRVGTKGMRESRKRVLFRNYFDTRLNRQKVPCLGLKDVSLLVYVRRKVSAPRLRIVLFVEGV